ncbi:MAG: hypothetical protein JSV35_03750 [Candidatus Bathyarchaeota archaeon]|nr:MAG: hypothetical protein JSV35_03750 [Candidatus Bathyarchaeota archaeon]
MRFADANEKFLGIGMNAPQLLDEGTLVLADQERILCMYPYRDSDQTKITLTTRNVGLIAYGAPRVSPLTLQETLKKTFAYIRRVSGGRTSSITVSAARNGPIR